MTLAIRTAPDGRWFGTGHSTIDDPAKAGAEAATAAFAGRLPTVAFVFCSIGYHVPELFDAIREQIGDETVIVGCTTSGQIATGEASRDGVSITAWGGPGCTVRTHVARDASGGLREAGAEAASCLPALTDREHKALLMLCDGLTGNQHEIVRGAFSVVGAAVPLVGGCAGDQLNYVRTYQFHGGRDGVEILSDTVIGVAIGSDAPLGVGIAHGWRKEGPAMIVTRSRDGRVYELDGEPALDVLLRRLGIDESMVDDEKAFRDAAFLHPLGLSRRSGEDIRVIHAGDRTDRSLVCLADVPTGALAWLMESDAESLVDGGRQAAVQAIEALGGEPARGMLVFDCAARGLTLGPDGMEQEIAGISKAMGEVPFGGFYTNGEVARVRGALGMHHFTLVTLALA
ncbi:FIST signal transduction protein [Paractinoplanes rishiriensis]|uniref:Histidine kinase n=1 Tax=Paractinoplanes rishiriensis TaxID=1050105 RepID=A0A919K686_9ACTN|nr:FIST N-terminal domain-containing protein [Actinoplanes rishiriensis]GIE97376.1 histidine kinase [Actinoplanes rishiriensis]